MIGNMSVKTSKLRLGNRLVESRHHCGNRRAEGGVDVSERESRTGFQPVTGSTERGLGRQAGCLSYIWCDRIAELETGITAGVADLKGLLK